MVASIKLLCALFFFCLLSKGNCQCSLGDISIKQEATEKRVGGQQEWLVTVSNNCVCSQYNVKLDCTGFSSEEIVDSSKLTNTGNECLINGGRPIFKSDPISFTYAWDLIFPFKPLSSQVACS
ncbi:uncharacterized protein At1g05835-like [Momordica charantia]|uniref:Uncharacterized protein At1g05835-like n=1 Tax=Momordica charantia TaxID=3673 RepID=A0A6J1CKK7_MOMCH|nr:uncharacterized protein At1g05835-like [Momordica charantia]